MEIHIIDKAHEADIRLPNEPFPLFARIVPTYDGAVWRYRREDFPPEQVTEMCFPDEAYDFDAMADSVFLGAYENDRCVGLAVLQPYYFRYMYLMDLKVSKSCRGKGVGKALIEKAEAAFDAKKAAELEQKLKSNKFTLSDFYDQLSQLKNMGSLDEIAAMMPGMNAGALKGAQVDEKAMARTEAIIQSMTPYERENPSVLNHSRKRRIALGAGVKVEDINKLLKQFDMMNQMMKQFSGPGAAKKMKRMGKFGGMGGLGGFPGL